jgi:hypothetical protein
MDSDTFNKKLAQAAVIVAALFSALLEHDGIARFSQGDHWFVADAVHTAMTGLFVVQLWWGFPRPILQANTHRAAAGGLFVSLLLGA